MFKRQTSGSVVCVSCGYLVGVNDDKCYHCGRRNPGLWGFAPALRSLGQDLGFVNFVTATCVVVYVITLLLSGTGLGQPTMSGFLAPSPGALFAFGASGAFPVFEFGRWWTVLSAGWLHGGFFHILFNLYWIRQLAPSVAELFGPGRMVLVYTAGCVLGFLLSSVAGQFLTVLPILQGGQLTVGASAPIFGLLGALVCYGRRTGSSVITSQVWPLAIIMFVFGFLGRGTDNWAHLGGFAGGYLAALWLDPHRPERVDHMLWAVICLALSVLSILASVVTAYLG